MAFNLDDPIVDYETLRAANIAHDEGMRRIGLNPTQPSRIRTGWYGTPIRGRILTDKLIEKYRSLGYYSVEYREARKKLMQRKATTKAFNRASGNFFQGADGRLIYNPF